MRALLSAFQLVAAGLFAQGLVTFGPVQLLPAPLVMGIGAVLSFFSFTRRVGKHLVAAGSTVGTCWAIFIALSFRESDLFKIGALVLIVAGLSDLAAYKLYRHATTVAPK